MKTIREVGEFKIIYEPLQRMYRLSNLDSSLLSYWFNSNDLDDYLVLSDEEFIDECKKVCS